MFNLKGRTAVIEGGSGNIGIEIIRQFLDGGMNVVSISFSEEKAKLVRDMLPGYGEQLWASGKVAMEKIYDKYGSIDVIVCVQGPFPEPGEITDITDERLDSVIHNIPSYFQMIRSALPYLKKSSAPRIILSTACDAGMNLIPEEYDDFAFSTIKGAINSMTISAARKLAKYGITVNAVSNGAIYNISPLAKFNSHDGIENLIPLRRMPTPKDIASAYCYLASEEAGFITGEILKVNGGLAMG